MKRLSLRMRMTVITSLCLTIACIVMVLALFWLANIQVVQYIDLEIPEDSMETIREIQESFAYGEWVEGEFPLEGAEEALSEAAEEGLRNFYFTGAVILLLVILSGSVMAWVVSGWSIAPVKKLSQEIDHIDEQKLATHIDEFTAGDELQKLAESFNNMLKRLDYAFAREKRFSAAAAHELKTPLTVMKASMDVLELSEAPSREEYQETIDCMKKQISRLNELILELLSFARCQDSGVQAEICLDEVLSRLMGELKSAYPEIALREEQVEPCTFMGNPALVERVLFNLLDNAAKFSPGGGTVSVRLYHEGEKTVFCVKDQGPGISQEAAAHIFEPFYREDQSRNRKIAGAGLGLALVKEFTDACGGTIVYSPNHPCGSVFTLSIPQKKVELSSARNLSAT